MWGVCGVCVCVCVCVYKVAALTFEIFIVFNHFSMSGKPGSPPPVRAYSSSGRASSKSRHTVYADPDTLPRASSIRRENTGKRSIGSWTSSTQNQPSFAEPTSATKRLKKVPVNYAELIPGYESMVSCLRCCECYSK